MPIVSRSPHPVPQRASKTGLALCLVYLAASSLCVATALGAGDDKGRYVLLQLPLTLQAAALDSLGARTLLRDLSWPVAYLLIGSATLAVLYVTGMALGAIARRCVRRGCPATPERQVLRPRGPRSDR